MLYVNTVIVGFYFAMGHSTVVIVAAAVVAVLASALRVHFQAAHIVGGIISTTVSALFLLTIAAINLVIYRSVWLTFRHIRHGGAYVEEDFDLLLNKRGITSRLFRPLFG